MGLGYYLLRGSYNSGLTSSNNNSNSSGSGSQTSDACSGAPEATSAVTITYSDSGFSPSLVSIKTGGTLTIKNTASDAVQVNSNPHPLHTDDSDLNIGTIEAGQEKTATITKTGCFGYHNHLNSSEKGQILIK